MMNDNFYRSHVYGPNRIVDEFIERFDFPDDITVRRYFDKNLMFDIVELSKTANNGKLVIVNAAFSRYSTNEENFRQKIITGIEIIREKVKAQNIISNSIITYKPIDNEILFFDRNGNKYQRID